VLFMTAWASPHLGPIFLRSLDISVTFFGTISDCALTINPTKGQVAMHISGQTMGVYPYLCMPPLLTLLNQLIFTLIMAVNACVALWSCIANEPEKWRWWR